MRRIRRGLVGIAGAAILAPLACGPPSTAPAATVVDSAGVRIVTYALDRNELPVWRTLVDADLEIGVPDGDPAYTLSRIVDLAVTADGRVLVSDGATPGVRVYDASGTWERTLGQRGDGPGEFSSPPTFAGTRGDKIGRASCRERV